ncbi:MAG: hypothetical protein ACF8OB_17300 [Phycisphaeraceae bacterium JB051]
MNFKHCYPSILTMLLLVCVGLGFFGRCANVHAQADRHPRVNVLVLADGDLKIDKTLAKQLKQENIHFVAGKLSDPLNEQMLKSFHTVLIADYTGPSMSYLLKKYVQNYFNIQQNLKLIDRYVREGGSFFFSPVFGDVQGAMAYTQMLKPYGMSVLPYQIRDHEHLSVRERVNARPDEYGWTTNISKHPATEGVKQIVFSQTMFRWDDMYSNPVIRLHDKAWQPLVTSMPSAVAARGFDYVRWETIEEQSPVIAAVRDVEKGRLGVLSPCHYYTFTKPYDDPKHGWIRESHTGRIDGSFMDKGIEGHPSDGRKLLINMFRWLADAARKQNIGQYDAQQYAALPKPENAPTPDFLFHWDTQKNPNWHKMFVGARSQFSDGTGTIAQYAKAAKDAGIGMLYMTETFEHFDPKQWDTYRQACADASDDTVKVMAGLDIPDPYGNRYLLLNSPIFPQPFMLTADGKAMLKTHYLALTFPNGIVIAHRPSTSPLPEELLKHFQGVSVFTYRDGQMIDNSLSAYEWQLYRYSNPMPYVVHETYSPQALKDESNAGHQLYAAAPTLNDLHWYFSPRGNAHFWESPVPMQLSSGPMVKSFGNKPFLEIESDAPITDVSLNENFNLYRRWKPNSKTFKVDQVKLPEVHVNWTYVNATDANGNNVITAGKHFGKQAHHTWRCGDRQNWWSFPNLYTGTTITQFQLELPTYWTKEGSGGYNGFPNVDGPLRGENMVSILDFAYASPQVYIQDSYLDQRYYNSTYKETVFDAKPSQMTNRSRVFEAKVRYQQFPPNNCRGNLASAFPMQKQVTIKLRRPVQVIGDVFPAITNLDIHHARVKGDMNYAYADPKTGKEITGKLTKGYVDLPKGGSIGGLIVLCDGLRVDHKGKVGFAAPDYTNGSLPIGHTWEANFVTVPPSMVQQWRKLLGFTGEKPYEVSVSQGTLDQSNMVHQAVAQNFGISGQIVKTLPESEIDGIIIGSLVTESTTTKYKAVPLTEYRVPVDVQGVNYNWPAAVVQQGKLLMPVDVFEGKARTRLDVMIDGSFYIGNTLMSDAPNLRIAVVKWDDKQLVCEVNNPTDKDIDAKIWSAAQLQDRSKVQGKVSVGAGQSKIITIK